jgi:hypothetical protein
MKGAYGQRASLGAGQPFSSFSHEGIVKSFSLLDELSPQKAEKGPFAMYFLQKEAEKDDLSPTLEEESKLINS